MAHFAEIDSNNIVLRVVVVNNIVLEDGDLVEQEHLGIEFLQGLLGGDWVQTSYNGNFRKNFAGVGFTYDTEKDAFIPQKPYSSWRLNDDTCKWEPPAPMPDDNKLYLWNENTLSWDVIDDGATT
jgi:hypothetical protein